jgi:hypothetical protein
VSFGVAAAEKIVRRRYFSYKSHTALKLITRAMQIRTKELIEQAMARAGPGSRIFGHAESTEQQNEDDEQAIEEE